MIVAVEPVEPEEKPEPGLACSNCACRDLPVYYTRSRRGFILRSRECRNCGKRMTTREKEIGKEIEVR